MKSLFLQLFKFCLLSGLALGVHSVYANTLSQNQCAKLLEAKAPSFAAFIRAKMLNLQGTQSNETQDQLMAKETQKEDEGRQRDEVRIAVDPVHNARKIKFLEMKPREFLMGYVEHEGFPVSTEITRSYGIMDSKMTQMMYAQLMILFEAQDLKLIFPSHFTDGPNSLVYIYKGMPISMRPDDPVMNVSWHDINDFFLVMLNAYSKKEDSKIQSILKIFIVDHKQGDQYGLLTEAQIENAMKQAVTIDNDSIDAMINRGDDKKLKQYVVYTENTDFKTGTQPEASLLPLFIEGVPIYMHGNVAEILQDLYDPNVILKGGKDPLGSVGRHRSVRGGSWMNISTYLHSAQRFGVGPSERSEFAGFRLARLSRLEMGATPGPNVLQDKKSSKLKQDLLQIWNKLRAKP